MRYLHTPFPILLAAVMLLVACGDICGVELQSTRRSVRYLIPDGYVGWLRIDYGVNDAHAPGYGVKRALPLPVKDGAVIVELPPGGHLVTSSPMEFGAARDEYYYSGNGSLKALSQAHDTGMVWNKFNGRFGGAASQTEFMFIGSSADYQKYGYRHETPPMHGPIKR
jgi:hypothetical protein